MTTTITASSLCPFRTRAAEMRDLLAAPIGRSARATLVLAHGRVARAEHSGGDRALWAAALEASR